MADSDSLTQESDEIFEMFCEHCEQELGETVKADGFCADCLEYLCAICLRYHQRYKSDHTIQDRDNMPQDFCVQKCQDHPKELIKFYCTTCQQKACIVCKTKHHMDCLLIEHIPMLVRSTNLKHKVSETIKSIDKSLEAISDSKDDVTSKLSDIQSFQQSAMASIKKHTIKLVKDIEEFYQKRVCELVEKQKNEMELYQKKRADQLARLYKEKEDLINKHQVQNKNLQDNRADKVDEIERQKETLIKETESLHLIDKTIFKALSPISERNEAKLKVIKQNLSWKMIANKKCEVFLAIKEAENLMKKTKKDLKAVNRFDKINNYGLETSNAKINRFTIALPIKFGILNEKSKIRRNISHMKEIYTAQHTDKKGSSITGLCKISDSHLIAADNLNASIKVINIHGKLVSEVVNLEDEPFDVTLIKTNMAATTLPFNASKIQLLSFMQDNHLSLSSQVTVPDKCYGISFKKPNLIVGCLRKIHILGLNGTLVNTITTSDNITKQVRLRPYRNELFVIEELLGDENVNKTSVLTKITMSDDSIERQQHKSNVTGLAVDKAGTCFTCTTDGFSIVQTSPDFQTEYIHKVQQVPVARTLRSMYFCNKENQLYVGTNTGIVMVFDAE